MFTLLERLFEDHILESKKVPVHLFSQPHPGGRFRYPTDTATDTVRYYQPTKFQLISLSSIYVSRYLALQIPQTIARDTGCHATTE